MSFFKTFWTVALSLAGIVGLYLTAEPLDLVWLFWIVIAIAVIVAAVRVVLPRAVRWAQAIRDYPSVLSAAGTAQSENEDLRRLLREEQSRTATRYEEGKKVGAQLVRGPILGIMMGMPDLVAVDVADGGAIFVGSYEADPSVRLNNVLGARFSLVARNSKAVRGVVEVVSVDHDERLVRLSCVERTMPAFWSALYDTAQMDSTVPADVMLATAKSPFEAAAERAASPEPESERVEDAS